MLLVHLTSSRFLGGPERQMLELAKELGPEHPTVFLSFAEGGRCSSFLEAARQAGWDALALKNDTPNFRAAIREIADQLQRVQARTLFCHGYKADLLGRLAARRQGIPAIAVSRGWTGEDWKVRWYEALDRWALRWMDRVVCVSESQGRRVIQAGVPPERTMVIPNAIRTERFHHPDPSDRRVLLDFFGQNCSAIVGSAGRLSPEKGFSILVQAARKVIDANPSVGFILFGSGTLEEALRRQIEAAGLGERFILTPFRPDLDRFIPHFDVLAVPSFTEGLPNVVLEALAAQVPVVASTVGGIPELIEDGVSGQLVKPGDPQILADRLLDLLASEPRRRAMAQAGRTRVRDRYTFAAQRDRYLELLGERHLEACGAGLLYD
jgi:glycosyltransferase involved in cell wall biosynthesis